MNHWRKFIISFLCVILGAILCFGIALWYFWHDTVRVAPRLISKVRTLANEWVGIDFTVETIAVMPSKYTVKVDNLKLSKYENDFSLATQSADLSSKNFFGADSLIFTIASNSAMLELFHSKVVIEKVELSNVYYDANAPLPDSKSKKIEIPWIPVRRIIANGLDLKSKYGDFKIEDFNADFERDKNKGRLQSSFKEGPLGAVASITADFDLYDGDGVFCLSIKQNSKALLALINTYISKYGIELKDSSFESEVVYKGNLLNRINDPYNKIGDFIGKELSGSIKLSGLEFAYNKNKGKITAEAVKNKSDVWGLDIESDFLGAKLSLKGKADGEDDDYNYKINSSLNNLKLSDSFFKMIDYFPEGLDMVKFGTLNLTADIIGNKEKVTAKGILNGKQFKVYDKLLKVLQLNWNCEKIADKLPTLDGILNVHSEVGSASATAKLTIDEKNKIDCFIQDGIFKNIDVAFLGTLFKQSISGYANGSFAAEIDFNQSQNATYTADFCVKDGNFFGVTPKIAKGYVKGQGTEFYLSDPVLEFERNGIVKAKGTVSMNDCAAEISVASLPIDLLGVSEKIATGSINAKATLKGQLLKPELRGAMDAKNFAISGLKVNRLNASFEGKENKYSLTHFILRPDEGSQVDGFASFDIEKGALQSLNLSLQQVRLSTFRYFLTSGLLDDKCDGKVSGSVSYDNNQNQNIWNFYIDSYGIKIADQFFNSLFAEGSVVGKEADIKNIFVKAYDGSISLSGHMENLSHFYGQVEGIGLNYKKMKFLEKYLPQLSGNLDFRGDIDFEGDTRNGEFVVFSRNMKIPERDLGNFGGNVIINNDKLIIDKGEFDKLGIKLSGELDWAGNQPYKADLEMNNVDLSFIPRAHGFNAIDKGGLLINGKGKVIGNVASRTPELAEILIDKLVLRSYDEIMETSKPVKISYQNDGLELRSFELKYKDGTFCGEGIFRPNENTALSFWGRNFSVDAIAQLAGMKRGDFGGIISFDGSVYGKIDNLELSVESEVASLTAYNRIIPQLKASLNTNFKEVNLKKVDAILPNSVCELSGKLFLGEDFTVKNSDLNLKLDNGPVSDIVTYAPEIFKSASGTIDLDLNLRGNIKQPIIVGNLKILADSLLLKVMKKPLKNINVSMTTENDIFKLDTFELEMGKGKVIGDGSISFAGENRGKLNVKVSGEKLDLNILTLDLNNASFTVALTGDLMNPIVDTDIFLPKSKLILDTSLLMFKSNSEPLHLPFNSLNYDLRVLIPGNFKVRNGFLNSEFSGDFGVSGDLENFKIDGMIKCVRGKLFFKRRQFKIEEGEIKFGGIENSFDPYIYVKSEGQIQTTRIYLTLNGFLSDFKPQVYSTPPMSEGDIIAMLTLGMDLNAAQNSDSKDLFEEQIVDGLANSYLSSVVGGTISQALNLDEVYMTSAYDKSTGKSQSYLRVGKYLTEKFFMAYEGNMDQNDKETYIFEYRLPRGFTLNLEFKEPEKEQEFGIKYDFKF